ncbi:exodeoxyribonuclease VII large subunit [Permianibacter sp. IMCC34836]|uniref:exodeoxyribonuclease VII large subunit n=1 Tax=Permianibacter fluminis TaxID=2738515 RepID=UPI0015581C1C|nr:exodeoxyribonuclease VII large subunit [Permianibacter fluminis]NQD38641.1 exodeoxyribonuclease VII large subunit [Permianibacter fluminis]
MTSTRKVYTVSELVGRARRVLEQDFGLLWLEAEISNFSAPPSGHWYFTLKDEGAQVRSALFRNRNQLLSYRPKDGDKVLIRGRVTVYEPRGDFQLVCEYLEPAGFGALQQKFEQLKQKLADEGLFNAERKRVLPPFPTTVGVITSPTGAAIRDVLSVLAKRAPFIKVILYPAVVQGAEAPAALIEALKTANRRRECDVLLLTRGGGSLEDLFCFNDEKLARQIAGSGIPVVSAVGHEVDFTIADFVADLRAPTPSAGAALLSPDRDALRQLLGQLGHRQHQVLQRAIRQRRSQLDSLSGRLPTPERLLARRAQRLDELRDRLLAGSQRRLQLGRLALAHQEARLRSVAPAVRLASARHRLASLQQRLVLTANRTIEKRRTKLARCTGQLATLSPLATLSRGYTLTRIEASGVLLQQQPQLPAGTLLETRLPNRRVLSRVETDEVLAHADPLAVPDRR